MSTNPADVLAYSKAATEGVNPEWFTATAPAEGSVETKAEYMAGALTDHGPLWVVFAPGSGDGTYQVPAVTGDGPHGEALAAFIANARTDLPALAAFALDVLVELDTDEHVGMSRDEAIGYNAARELILQLATKHGIEVTA